MAGIADEIIEPVKLIMVGLQGEGKTGSLASLVCAGQKLRILDTDKGARTLRSLLTNPNYPYAAIVKKKGIDLNTAVRYISIDTEMELRDVKGQGGKIEQILAPKNAEAWPTVMRYLNNWKEVESSRDETGAIVRKTVCDLGPASKWGTDCTLVFDTLATLSTMAYYYIQSLNGRLGAREDGFDYQRDIGGAQAQIRRLMEMLGNAGMNTNVIIMSHINRIDTAQGFNRSPDQIARDATANRETPVIDAKGFPEVIGKALSPKVGKFFNNVFMVKSSGSGGNVKRTICCQPIDNVAIKNSDWLEREYDTTTGLAEIYAAMRGEVLDPDLVAIRKTKGSTPAR